MISMRRNRKSNPWAMRAGLIAGGAAAAGAIAVFANRRRRHIARDRAAAIARRSAQQVNRQAQYMSGVVGGAAHMATSKVRSQERSYDDTTLARKVESELFRPADAPKGSVNVNVHDGIVELRGEVERSEDLEALAKAAARVDGVRDVHNLLHTPGSPPLHSPPSDPDEVRARAARNGG
jgi:osmotically-inducible protein OsmY